MIRPISRCLIIFCIALALFPSILGIRDARRVSGFVVWTLMIHRWKYRKAESTRMGFDS